MGIPLAIREMTASDPALISQAFYAQGWNKPESQYQQYLRECESGQRVVLLAEVESQFAGYICILWSSHYPYFREASIPEIADFNVLKIFQRRGIGSALMDEAEKRICQRSQVAGIGVGLAKDYGPAQILYVRRGYVPDGLGLSYNEHFPQYGELVRVDDDLVLCLTKRLV